MEYDSELYLLSPSSYFDSTVALVDPDEYTEMIKNLPSIISEATNYVNTYIKHITGTSPIHPREFARKYQYSTLPYFHDIMGI